MQRHVNANQSPISEEEKDRTAPKERYNLEDAFINIDGTRHNVKDLLKLVVDKLKTRTP